MSNELNGRKIAILTEEGFEEVELTSPMKALERAGATVNIVSPQRETVRGRENGEWKTEFSVDISLDTASSSDYDALLIPGGVVHPDKLRINESALRFVREFSDAGKPIAAICHGPQVLINAELVKGKKVTSVDAIRIDLENAGAHWEDSEVVEDQGLVTSRTPEDLPAFNAKIIAAFAR